MFFHLLLALVLAFRLYIPMLVTEATLEERLYAGHNAERASAGVPLLQWDEGLAAIARDDAVRQMERGYLEHDGLYRQPAVDLYPNATWVGENLAVANSDLASVFMSAWLASPGHHANILDPDYNLIGIGSVRDAEGRTWIAVVFVDLGN